jgi:hypothetical protein
MSIRDLTILTDLDGVHFPYDKKIRRTFDRLQREHGVKTLPAHNQFLLGCLIGLVGEGNVIWCSSHEFESNDYIKDLGIQLPVLQMADEKGSNQHRKRMTVRSFCEHKSGQLIFIDDACLFYGKVPVELQGINNLHIVCPNPTIGFTYEQFFKIKYFKETGYGTDHTILVNEPR